jgi:Cdc37 C terminal domain
MDVPDDDNPLIEQLPLAVRAALLAEDIQALDLALRAMPRDEAEELLRWMLEAGILKERKDDELDREQRAAYGASAPPQPGAWPPTVERALESGNIDAVYRALAELPPETADRIYAELQAQGLL